MEARGSGGTYTGSLTISPLAEGQDDGQYTCSVAVSRGGSVLEATNNDSTTIDVMGKDSTTAYSPEENMFFSICMYVCVCDSLVPRLFGATPKEPRYEASVCVCLYMYVYVFVGSCLATETLKAHISKLKL